MPMPRRVGIGKGRGKRTPEGCENIRLGCAKRPKPKQKLCRVEGCLKRTSRKGLCQMHAWRLQFHGDEMREPTKNSCQVSGCDRAYKSGGYCSLHLGRMKRHGSTDLPERPKLSPKKYHLVKIVGHPLAHANTERVYVHRAVLFEQIGWMRVPCFWCGTRIRFSKGMEPDALIPDHLDHDRHNNDLSNLVPACNRCNCSRPHWRKTPLVSVYQEFAT